MRRRPYRAILDATLAVIADPSPSPASLSPASEAPAPTESRLDFLDWRLFRAWMCIQDAPDRPYVRPRLVGVQLDAFEPGRHVVREGRRRRADRLPPRRGLSRAPRRMASLLSGQHRPRS